MCTFVQHLDITIMVIDQFDDTAGLNKGMCVCVRQLLIPCTVG